MDISVNYSSICVMRRQKDGLFEGGENCWYGNGSSIAVFSFDRINVTIRHVRNGLLVHEKMTMEGLPQNL